jgi:radical SAM superfamily enzyme YgiQ (UPF0313 family)
MNILLVSPKSPDTFWSYKYALRFISKRAAFPPLGLLTVAGMLPSSWNLKLVDLNVSSLRDWHIRWADYVMISGMIVHKDSVREIVTRCKSLGRTLIGGGPLFTTGHEEFGSELHYVLGEAENVMPDLVTDMRVGRLRPHYQSAKRPDISRTPIPRWDLINTRYYAALSLQFSRGCPYNCEFCDIIIMNGRQPRTKSTPQMLTELDAIQATGWKGSVFVVDDNFIGNKTRAKDLLRAMIDWRQRTNSRIQFLTEASVNLADDAQLLQLMSRAGFKRVFLGIETPVNSSLVECKKVQNSRRNLGQSVQIIQRAGLEVMGGFIVGFDNDPRDIFQRQFDFIQQTGIVTAMVGLLSALPQTQLYNRLMKEGRMKAASSGNNTQALLNFDPVLDRNFLLSGYRRLMQTLYEPKSYYQRILTFLREYRPQGPTAKPSWPELKAFIKSLWLMGVWHKGRGAYWRFFTTILIRYPHHFPLAMTLTIHGHHFRLVAARL